MNKNLNLLCKPHIISSSSNNSILGSFDTNGSLTSELDQEKNIKVLPSAHKFLFQKITPETNKFYENLYSRLGYILDVLEENLTPVNIRDDCSVSAKPVFLRLPDRRRTVPPRLFN